VKICYAFRANRIYPFEGKGPGNELPDGESRAAFLAKVRTLGVDGLELGITSFGGPDGVTEASAKDLARRLADDGTPVLCIRGGGGFDNPMTARQHRKAWEANIKLAAWTGANLVNSTVCSGQRDKRLPGYLTGEPKPQISSRHALQSDFEANARQLREVADLAADHGVTISIEVHQHSIVDNSWSALLLHEMVGRKNFGINPDLGNIYWTFDVPEETSEAAIKALAPVATYWHCKNLYRVHLPHDERSVFLRAALPDGEIDYRFAIAAMQAAGYQGCLAIEGSNTGDQFGRDAKSVAFVRSILSEGAY
jgi:sugar phosphate isomerase/epimerase